MAVIPLTKPIEGVPGVLPYAGTPSAGTSEVQTLAFGGTWIAAETFKLKFEGATTAAIAWSATDATLVANIDAALEALPTIGTGNVVVADSTLTTGIGNATVTFGGTLASKVVGIISVAENNSAAGTLVVTETTPGVNATFRGLAKGSVVPDTTNGILYQNTGTGSAPTFTKVGTQS